MSNSTVRPSELPKMKEAPVASKEKFEIFYTRPSWSFLTDKPKLSQIDVQDIGESYRITLTFEKDLRNGVKVKSGLLEISGQSSGDADYD